MKDEKGITLLSLVIYILLSTIIIAVIALMSSNFFSNVDVIVNQDKYAVEFNKFNMFFINDVKSNTEATVEPTKITFKDNGAVYELKGTDMYRNDTIIANQIQSVKFSEDTYTVPNTLIDVKKKIIKVQLTIGRPFEEGTLVEDLDKKAYQRLNKTIEYVLKYW